MTTIIVRQLKQLLVLLAFTGLGSIAWAEEADTEANAVTGMLELGVGQVEDANYRFGRFNGLKDDDVYVTGGFDVKFRPGRPDYLRLHGRDLGLDSRWLSLEYGKQGKFETHINYNELPHFTYDSAQTPFAGVGSENLILAPGASPTNLHPLTIETKRKQLSGGAALFLPKHWKTSLEVRQEHKSGTDWIAGGLQRNNGGPGISIGQSYSVMLPEPIDQTTTEMDAALEYNGKKSQLKLTLHGSLFNNADSRLRWENPGFVTPGAVTLPAAGQISLPPDNRFFQLGLSGSSQVGATTRLTGLASIGLMQQDEPFLPYGLTTAGGLPRDSLDGEVYVYSLRAGLTSRPFKPLRLKAQYRYDERDNRTPEAAYLYDVMDSGKTQNPAVAVTNKPLSYRKHKAKLDANYRFSPQWKGSAGYEHRITERDNADVEKSRENIGRIGLTWQPRDDLDATLRLSEGDRKVDAYEAESTNQNPLLQKYYQADRDRTQGGLMLNYTPAEKLSIGFSVDLIIDDFTDSDLGLTDADSRIYTLDVGYQASPDLYLNAFYSREDIESAQRGSDPGFTPLYKVDFEDTVDTAGIGARVENLWNHWNVSINYRYSKGSGDIRYSDPSGLTAASSFPTLTNELHAVELSADYKLNKTTTIKVAMAYENLTAEDWALDNVGAYPANQLLTLGNESEDYDIFAFMIGMQYRF